MLALGLDPGVHLGWCLLEIVCPRPRYVAGGEIEAGLRSGSKERVDDAAIDAVVIHLRTVLERAGVYQEPLVAAVERVRRVHPTAKHARRTGQEIGTAIGTGLADCQWIGGELRRAVLQYPGVQRVATVTEATWRRAICGPTPPGMTKDAWVAKVVQARIDSFPNRSTNHQRDAAGIAEWIAITTRGMR